MSNYQSLFVSILTLGWMACHPAPGEPDYSSHQGIRKVPMGDAGTSEGPNPFSPSVPRLKLGVFYEGGATETIAINEVDTHYYIFENSYRQESSEDRIEGASADLITLNGTAFWGGGVIWDSSRDLSAWSSMFISLKSDSPSFAEIPIILQSESGGMVSDSTVMASQYGYKNDGQWHSLQIPLSDFAGFNAVATRSPLILSASGGDSGDTLLIDDFYYTQD